VTPAERALFSSRAKGEELEHHYRGLPVQVPGGWCTPAQGSSLPPHDPAASAWPKGGKKQLIGQLFLN